MLIQFPICHTCLGMQWVEEHSGRPFNDDSAEAGAPCPECNCGEIIEDPRGWARKVEL